MVVAAVRTVCWLQQIGWRRAVHFGLGLVRFNTWCACIFRSLHILVTHDLNNRFGDSELSSVKIGDVDYTQLVQQIWALKTFYQFIHITGHPQKFLLLSTDYGDPKKDYWLPLCALVW